MAKNRTAELAAETTEASVLNDTETVQDITVSEQAAVAAETAAEPAAADVAAVKTAYPEKLVYIGPTVFRTYLVSGRVFITGGRSIDELLTEDLRNYPLARTLFVKPEEAAAAMSKIFDPGTAIGNAYRKLSGR